MGVPPPRAFPFLNLPSPSPTIPSHSPQAVAAAPADPALLAARSQAHLQLGHWLEAADDARRACDLAPANAKAWLRRGCVVRGGGVFLERRGARAGGEAARPPCRVPL